MKITKKKTAGNKTNHPRTAGSFKPGPDERRNLAGQMQKETVALGQLLKQYLTDEGSRSAGPGEGTKAEALAARIMKHLTAIFSLCNSWPIGSWARLKTSCPAKPTNKMR